MVKHSQTGQTWSKGGEGGLRMAGIDRRNCLEVGEASVSRGRPGFDDSVRLMYTNHEGRDVKGRKRRDQQCLYG